MQNPRLGSQTKLQTIQRYAAMLREHAERLDLGGRRTPQPDLSTTALPSAPGDLTIYIAESFDRFEPAALRPVIGRPTFKFSLPGRVQTPMREKGQAKPWRLLDWGLLGVEAAGALIVAWLAFQYVYTVYFDTAPHHLAASPLPPALKAAYDGELSSGRAVNATATPTRFSEVAAPLVGGATASQGGPSPTGLPQVTATATATIEPALLLPNRLRVPVMFLQSPVHEVHVNMGTWEVSEMEIGHHEGSGNPGEPGNVVLAGHRDINSALFRELDRLKPGDEVFVSNSLHEYRYIVEDSFVVGPQHTEVMDSTDDKRVTLITCTPIGLATQRLIVVAKLDAQHPYSSTP